jgi:hypothetical protein
LEEKALRERLAELSEALCAAPLADRGKGTKGTYVSHVPPRSSKTAEELLDYVRLQTKYVMFDLEATRRENRYLRQMLERRTNLGDAADNL